MLYENKYDEEGQPREDSQDHDTYLMNLIDTPVMYSVNSVGSRGLLLLSEQIDKSLRRCGDVSRRHQGHPSADHLQLLPCLRCGKSHLNWKDLEIIPVINKIDLPAADIESTKK